MNQLHNFIRGCGNKHRTKTDPHWLKINQMHIWSKNKVEMLRFCNISSFLCLFFRRDLALYRTKYADVYEFTPSALISLSPQSGLSLMQQPTCFFSFHIFWYHDIMITHSVVWNPQKRWNQYILRYEINTQCCMKLSHRFVSFCVDFMKI